MSRKAEITRRDEELLAQLGYKQEFKRAFTPLEAFGFSFSVVGLFPSMTSVLFYALPNGGPVSMVWGWAGACILVFCVCLSIAELASAAPTAGGVSGVDLYFDFLLGLLLDPPLRFASLAKPAFLDSWLCRHHRLHQWACLRRVGLCCPNHSSS